METSRSRRFLLTLNPENLPHVEKIAFHWKNLEQETLTPSQWADILRPLNAASNALDKEARLFLAQAVKNSNTHRVAYESSLEVESCEDMLSVFEFFSRHNYNTVPSSFFCDMHLRLQPHLASLAPHELTVMLRGLEGSHHIPDNGFWNDFQRAFLDCADKASPHDLEHIYHAAAKLALPMKHEMIVLLRDYLIDNHDGLTRNTRNKLLWASSVIDCLHSNANLKDAVTQVYRKHGIDDAVMRNSICAWFHIPAQQIKTTPSNKKSKTEKRLKEFFARASVHICSPEERFVPMIASPVDLRLRYQGKDIIMEADGLTHFNFDFSGRAYYNGSTLFLSALKAKMAEKSRIIHVDFRSCDLLFNRVSWKDQPHMATRILDKIHSLPAGNYHLKFDQDDLSLGQMKENRLNFG